MSTVSLSFYVRGGDGRKKREGRRKREKVGGSKKTEGGLRVKDRMCERWVNVMQAERGRRGEGAREEVMCEIKCGLLEQKVEAKMWSRIFKINLLSVKASSLLRKMKTKQQHWLHRLNPDEFCHFKAGQTWLIMPLIPTLTTSHMSAGEFGVKDYVYFLGAVSIKFGHVAYRNKLPPTVYSGSQVNR